MPLSPADRTGAMRDGLIAIDCSWNRLASRGSLPDAASSPRTSRRRRLPWLVATNPQHHGRVAELNTAEALAAALHLLGEPGRARELLHGFPGGDSFWRVNADRFDRYRKAATAEDIISAERFLG